MSPQYKTSKHSKPFRLEYCRVVSWNDVGHFWGFLASYSTMETAIVANQKDYAPLRLIDKRSGSIVWTNGKTEKDLNVSH